MRWKVGMLKRTVAMVEVRVMVSVPKGKAAGSVVASAADAVLGCLVSEHTDIWRGKAPYKPF